MCVKIYFSNILQTFYVHFISGWYKNVLLNTFNMLNQEVQTTFAILLTAFVCNMSQNHNENMQIADQRILTNELK